MINTTQLDVNLPNANLRIEDISGSTTTVTLPVLLSPLPNETEKPADQALSGRETVAASAGESPKADEKDVVEELSQSFQKKKSGLKMGIIYQNLCFCLRQKQIFQLDEKTNVMLYLLLGLIIKELKNIKN